MFPFNSKQAGQAPGGAQSRLVSLLAVLMGLMLLYAAGCAKLFPKESRSDEQLYRQGERLFAEGKYRRASKVFEELLKEYFESEYKTRALFVLAESQFLRGKYEEAQSNYDKFLEVHPVHEWAEKAAYRSALCDFNRMLNYDKDQTYTRKAMEKLNNFRQKYPNSQYVEDVEKRIHFAFNRLMEHELYVADFYLKTKAYIPAISRYKKLLEDYPASDFRGRILFSLARAYEKTGEKDKAREVYKELNTIQPSSELGKKAKGKL